MSTCIYNPAAGRWVLMLAHSRAALVSGHRRTNRMTYESQEQRRQLHGRNKNRFSSSKSWKASSGSKCPSGFVASPNVHWASWLWPPASSGLWRELTRQSPGPASNRVRGCFERSRLFPEKWRQSVAAALARLVWGQPVKRHLRNSVQVNLDECVCESPLRLAPSRLRLWDSHCLLRWTQATRILCISQSLSGASHTLDDSVFSVQRNAETSQ